jgi:hypothetical protein
MYRHDYFELRIVDPPSCLSFVPPFYIIFSYVALDLDWNGISKSQIIITSFGHFFSFSKDEMTNHNYSSYTQFNPLYMKKVTLFFKSIHKVRIKIL